jgi:hypothetical protein
MAEIGAVSWRYRSGDLYLLAAAASISVFVVEALVLSALDFLGSRALEVVFTALCLLDGFLILGAIRVGIHVIPTISRLGEAEWRAALNSIISPAYAKATDLSQLADDLRARATPPKKLCAKLMSSFLNCRLSQPQIDALLAVWTERRAIEERRGKRRDRIFDVLMVLAAALLGYLFAVLYSPDQLHHLLLQK